MNLKKILGVILVICAVFTYSRYSEARRDAPLELVITLDKEEYAKDDNIMVNVKLVNIGKDPIYVNKRFNFNSKESAKEFREIYLTVISPEGEDLECKVNSEAGFPRTDNFQLLGKGEEAVLDRDKNVKYYYDFTKPGEYEITAHYKNIYGKELGLDVYKEEIISKPVKITLTEQ